MHSQVVTLSNFSNGKKREFGSEMGEEEDGGYGKIHQKMIKV